MVAWNQPAANLWRALSATCTPICVNGQKYPIDRIIMCVRDHLWKTRLFACELAPHFSELEMYERITRTACSILVRRPWSCALGTPTEIPRRGTWQRASSPALCELWAPDLWAPARHYEAKFKLRASFISALHFVVVHVYNSFMCCLQEYAKLMERNASIGLCLPSNVCDRYKQQLDDTWSWSLDPHHAGWLLPLTDNNLEAGSSWANEQQDDPVQMHWSPNPVGLRSCLFVFAHAPITERAAGTTMTICCWQESTCQVESVILPRGSTQSQAKPNRTPAACCCCRLPSRLMIVACAWGQPQTKIFVCRQRTRCLISDYRTNT